MVWYPMDWCYRMGISDIILITPPESAAPLLTALATNPALTSLPSPKAEVLAPTDLSQTTGTGDILRLAEVRDAIKGDFVVLPCDLISEMDGGRLLEQWMALNPLSTSNERKGALGLFYPTQGLENISTKKDETDFLATVSIATPIVQPPHGSLRSLIEEIVVNMPTDTLRDKLEEDKGFLRLRQALMETHGRVRMRMKYRDSHVYIFPKWVLEFVAQNEIFDSISEDVLGWWAKSRWQKGLAAKLNLPTVLEDKQASLEESTHSLTNGDSECLPLSSTKVSKPKKPAEQSFAARVGVAIPPPMAAQVIIPPLLAYVQPTSTTTEIQPLIRRVDTSGQLLSISLHLAKQTPSSHALSHEHKIHPSAVLEQQSRVSEADCLVASNVRIGFRSNIKESVIGANCEIGRNVRLTRCLLMEGVVVGDGVVLSGCTIGRRARIEGVKQVEDGKAEDQTASTKKKKGADTEDADDRTKLTDCEVAPNFVVESGTEAKGEKLMAFDAGDFDQMDGDNADLDDRDGSGDGSIDEAD